MRHRKINERCPRVVGTPPRAAYLYVPAIEGLRSKLRPGAAVLADNADMPQTRPYVELVFSLRPGSRGSRV